MLVANGGDKVLCRDKDLGITLWCGWAPYSLNLSKKNRYSCEPHRMNLVRTEYRIEPIGTLADGVTPVRMSRFLLGTTMDHHIVESTCMNGQKG